MAFDLYAGVGLFSLPLAKVFPARVAVEASPSSLADLRQNAANKRAGSSEHHGTVSGTKAETITRVRFGRSAASRTWPKGRRCHSRLGAGEIGYVACDPSTQARDLSPLLKAGYRISEAHLIDLFPQTYHIESLIRLVR